MRGQHRTAIISAFGASYIMRKLFLPCLPLLLLAHVARAEPVALDLAVGMYRIRAEVAHTQASRMTGLMYRTEMAADSGMLFVFPQPQKYCMWMRNTLIPLSVAFVDDKGVIINIADMSPQSDDSHCAARAVRYALETNAGWFAARKLRAGARITGLDRAPAPD
jgi:uncharacterized protein